MNSIGPYTIAVIGSIIGLAVLAVIVSQKANTSAVISSAGSALSGIIGAAVAPVSGGSGSTFGSNALGVLGVTG